MSAFICNSAHFAALAAFAVSNDRSSAAISEWRSASPLDSARRIARELALENIRSVCHRYKSDKPEEYAHIADEAEALAEKYYFSPGQLTPVGIIKMCHSYSYQSCETEDWTQTLAHRQIEWIRSQADRMLMRHSRR